MPRPKKNTTAASTAQHRRPRTTDPDARIALVDKQIQRLETLNANRRELIAKTEEKLNQRKEALCKSEAMLENARAKRERIVESGKGCPARRRKGQNDRSDGCFEEKGHFT